MVACKNCGKDNQPHYKFCLYCGSDILGSSGGGPEGDSGGDAATAPPSDPAGSVPASSALTTIPDGNAGPPASLRDEANRPAEVELSETPLPAPRPPSVYFSGEPHVLPIGRSGPIRSDQPTRPPDSPADWELPEALRDTEFPVGQGPGPGSGPRAPTNPARAAEPATTLRPESPPSRLCPTCQSLVPIGFQFCGQCGGRVDGRRGGGPGGPGRSTGNPTSGRLVLIRPDGSEGGHHPLVLGVNLLGRGSGPLFDADSYLSPLHLQVELLDSGLFTLRDAGSLNGVFAKLSEEEAVSDGAVFRIGQELLRFDSIRPPRPLEDGTEVMGSPNPGYWGRVAIIIGRAQDGSCFPLFGDAVVLGRERGDILFAEDGYVSGTHARISYRHGQVFLQDLASSNGTFLKVRGERTVRTGTFVLMGQQLFRLVAG